jgi:hypothetical protein
MIQKLICKHKNMKLLIIFNGYVTGKVLKKYALHCFHQKQRFICTRWFKYDRSYLNHLVFHNLLCDLRFLMANQMVKACVFFSVTATEKTLYVLKLKNKNFLYNLQ